MHAKLARRLALISMIAIEHIHNETLLELANCFRVQNAGLMHLRDECLKLVLHRASKNTPVIKVHSRQPRRPQGMSEYKLLGCPFGRSLLASLGAQFRIFLPLANGLRPGAHAGT